MSRVSLAFKIKLLHQDIQYKLNEINKNQNFIDLFEKNNAELNKQVKKRFEEIDKIACDLDELETLDIIKYEQTPTG